MAKQVTFVASNDNSPMARVDGKVSFPERNGQQAKVGETWEVEVSGSNPKGTVNFLRLISKVEAPMVSNEPATIIIVGRPWGYNSDVRIDGKEVPSEGMTTEAKVVQFNLPSAASMRSAAQGIFRLTAANVYVLMYESYNARRSSPSVVKTEGLKKIFDYGDGHGMRWGALFKVEADNNWLIDWNTPGHHSHGIHKHRAVGTRSTFERKDGDRDLAEAKQV